MKTVLVTGATGRQGGAAARALRADGVAVRALVRNLEAPAVAGLRGHGVEIASGNLDDPPSLRAACRGVDAVFSVQTPDLKDLGGDSETRHGRNLVEAALAERVPQFVHTSVSGAGDHHRGVPGWKEGRWKTLEHYWESKAYLDELVKDAGFPHWTVLRPSMFMENFVRPSFLFANWVENRLLTVLKPDTRLSLIAVDDIGKAVARIIAEPERFDGRNLELAGDVRSLREISAVLSEAWKTKVEAPDLTPEEALAQGLLPAFVNSQRYLNENPSPARPDEARALGLSPRTFAQWVHAKWP
ncbi:NmrA family NAD(P)-binding protein [Myxococcus sp. CA039A]|uniref:NmrA family NAD(P)-binding protein n=1 Tax=Myxococcus sp. CA039A TaxID=2741737 RepID=UPI00157B263E|nr:NmrA family NAD(P)-binding protein [Myxococcus sp. CA039A]NTX52055.1 NmrA family NAD(P)-binding protein [Myxococcus sp. CA039A]